MRPREKSAAVPSRLMKRLLAVVYAARDLEQCPECDVIALACGHGDALHGALAELDKELAHD